MRYAIVSDLHANMPAWQSVLNDLTDLKADKIICLGDVVGYGPNPVEVLESVYRVVNVTLMGNHDAAVCGRLDYKSFTPRAAKAINLHRQQLTPQALKWIAELPLTWEGPGFRCTHGDFSNPNIFRYIVAPESAIPSWQATPEQLLFVGHSHYPGIYVIGNSGKPHFVGPCDFELEDGKRYIINPGSVGYPRVGDIRSSYCIYDDQTKSVIFRMLPFDTSAYREATRGAGLEDDLWVEQKVAQQLPALRQAPPFGKSSTNPTTTKKLLALLKSDKRLIAATIAAALFFITLIVSAILASTHARHTQTPLATTIPATDLPTLHAYPLTPRDKNMLPPLPPALSQDGRLAGWRYAFEDRQAQYFHSGLRDNTTTLCIHNQKRLKAQLESPLLNLAGTQLTAVRLQARIRKPDSFNGTVVYQVITYSTDANGNYHQQALHPFEMRSAKKRLTPPGAERNVGIRLNRQTTHLRLRIECDFSGQLEIEQPAIVADKMR